MKPTVEHSGAIATSPVMAGSDAALRRVALNLTVMTLAALATAGGAQVRIPLVGTDVPFTLQTLAVLVTGLLLPPRLALGSMSLYLALGIWQILPFAMTTGLSGPTGGYLVGFLIAAPLISVIAGGTRRSLMRQFVAAILGTAVVFAIGVAWLTVWRGGDFSAAVATGLVPFVAEAFLKVVLAVATAQAFWKIKDLRPVDFSG